MSEIDIAEVRGWVREASEHARRSFNNVTAERKADRSLVTRADVEIEELLRARIAARYPDHAVIGEEQGGGEPDHEFVWCLDPIDGTGSFVAGLGTWCVSVGVLRQGQPYLGVIEVPMLGDCYWAYAGGQARRNELPITASAATTIDGNDWIGVPSNVHRRFQIDLFAKTRCLSSIAADCCYVARGSAVGAVVGRASLWDLAAGFAILDAAGAVVVGLREGTPLSVPNLLRERKLAEPILIGPPQLIPTLRRHIIPVAPR